MKSGDRIKWRYTHYNGGKSAVRHAKYGEFIGLIRHTKRHAGQQLAMVAFDGNKRVSRVPLSELITVEQLRAADASPREGSEN